MKVLFPMFTRGNIGKLLPIVDAINNSYSKSVFTELLVGGPLILDQGQIQSGMLEAFPILENAKVCKYNLGDGTKWGMTDSFGAASLVFNQVLDQIKPDAVVITGDRYEALALCIVSIFRGLPIIHVEGGERSGCIDESVRHAITKFACLHLVANDEARSVVSRLGEHNDSIIVTGATSMHYFSEENILPKKNLLKFVNSTGAGAELKVEDEFVVVNVHPDNFNTSFNATIVDEILETLRYFQFNALWLTPNNDAGSASINKSIRKVIADSDFTQTIRFIRALPVNYYASALYHSRFLVGNSSSGLRESSLIGLPTFNVGSRQKGRTFFKNVKNVTIGDLKLEVSSFLEEYDLKFRFPSSSIYGGKDSGKIAAQAIVNFKDFTAQKKPIYL